MSTHKQPTQLYKRCLTLMLALMVCVMPLLAAQAAAQPNTNGMSFGPYGVVNLRAAASTDARILAKLSNGARLEVKWALNGWSYVQSGSIKGYIASQLVYLDGAAPLGTAYVYTQNGGNLNVRYTASLSGKILGSLPFGAQVTVLEQRVGWTLIKSGKLCGYVAASYLSKDSKPLPAKPDPAPSATKGVIVGLRAGSSVNLRASASLSARILGNLYNGQQVDILGQSGTFYKVRALGQIGYIAKAYVSTLIVPIDRPTPPVVVDPEVTPAEKDPIPTTPEVIVPPVSVDPDPTPVEKDPVPTTPEVIVPPIMQ